MKTRPNNRTTTSMTLPLDLVYDMKDAAAAENRSVSRYVENALRAYLNAQKLTGGNR